MQKQEIKARLETMYRELLDSFPSDPPRALSEYSSLCRTKTIGGRAYSVWTDALQAALDENPAVKIDISEDICYFDAPVIVPSDRRILAHGARLQMVPGARTLLLRNRSVTDGSFHPEDRSVAPDENILIEGGTWAESNTQRMGYGSSGCFDEEHSLEGVTTCLLFSNVRNVVLKDMEFVNTAGFSVQIGNAERVVTENIHFSRCFADGVHLNGNIADILVRNISGYVGDDLVALNPYDWDNSGINFGPATRIMIDGVVSDPTSPYKAIRMLPGVYLYPEGGESHCRIDDLYLRGVKGIKAYKLYLQTIPYDDHPLHPALIGSCGSLYFEDLDIDLDGQIDGGLYEGVRYSEGYNIFGAFEILANVEKAEFESIRLTLHREAYPESCLVSVGPKSMTGGDLKEVFDPYASCRVNEMRFHDITVNGQPSTCPRDLVRVIRMKYNPDFPHSWPRGGEGAGEIGTTVIEA